MNNIKNAVSDTCAEVVDEQALVCSYFFNSLEVTECKVNNMDVISYTCAVMSVVIVTEYAEFFSLADGNLSDVWHKVVWNSVWIFAHCATLVCADWVEVTKQADAPVVVACIKVLEHTLNDVFCSAVWVCNSANLHILGERRNVVHSVNGS